METKKLVERLRFEASERAKDPEWFDEEFSQAIVSAAARITELEEALRPFAERPDDWTVDTVNAARAALGDVS